MIRAMFSIDNLIAVVKDGGAVKTGVDVYDREGTLLLAGDVLVDQAKTLETIKRNGLRSVPVAESGGLFNGAGQELKQDDTGSLILEPGEPDHQDGPGETRDVARRLKEIQEIRQEAGLQFSAAKSVLKAALDQIRESDGRFDVQAVQDRVSKMVTFSIGTGHPISYMGRELFSFDHYLLDHAVHVCAMGTAVIHRFNKSFSHAVESALWTQPSQRASANTFAYYLPDDLDDISLGLFIYDIGKALVPEGILNKTAGLTRDESRQMQRHATEFGPGVLAANQVGHPVLANMVQYHHGPAFEGEKRCYPLDKPASQIPLYVKICKLVDIYDAMISRRSYSEALNQTAAATELFRAYVHKDPMLQFVLHAFIKTIGLYPPGSIVYLKNGQMAYVLEDRGPIVLPFTNSQGEPLPRQPDPFDIRTKSDLFQVDADRSIQTPKEVFELLPGYIRSIAVPSY